jgi:hypothetical protein
MTTLVWNWACFGTTAPGGEGLTDILLVCVTGLTLTDIKLAAATGIEPSALPLGLYMQAAVCELADRTQARNWSPNLDAALYPDAPRPSVFPFRQQRPNK